MPTAQTIPSRAWPTTQITLLQQVADQSDRRAWDRFAQTYGPLVYRYCQRRGLQEADALDVAQEVLLQVSRAIVDFRYDPERGRFRSWLGTVTHRAMLKHAAQSRRSVIGLGGAASEQCLANYESQESLDEIWVESFNAHVYREATRRLRPHFSAETWHAFQATFAENRSPKEVADELQRTVGWVYQAKSQVTQRLRAEILYLAEDSLLLSGDATC